MFRASCTVAAVVSILSVLVAGQDAKKPSGDDKAQAVVKELDQAKADYKEGMKKAKEQFLKRFDQRIKEATEKGNLQAVKLLTEQKKAFAEEEILPRAPAVRSDFFEWFKAITATTKKMEEVFDKAVKEYTKAGQIEKAEAVYQEWDDFLDNQKKGDVRLTSMIASPGCKVQTLGSFIVLTGGMVQTKKQYTPPFIVRAVAKTNAQNLRFHYAKGELIFNWEVKPTEFRVHDPADMAIGAYPGKGFVRPNQFHEIVWEMLPDVMRVYADGNLVCERSGQYLGLSSEVGIGSAYSSVVTVSHFAVMPLQKDK